MCGVQIGRCIGLHGDGAVACHNRFDFFVGKYGSDTAAAGLFVADHFSARIPPGKVQTAEVGVLGAGAGGDHGDVHRLFIKVVGQCLGHFIGIFGQVVGFEDFNLVFNAVDEDDQFFVGLAFDLDGIEPGEFFIGAEVTAHVGIDGGAGEGGDGGDNAFSAAGITRGAAQGT